MFVLQVLKSWAISSIIIFIGPGTAGKQSFRTFPGPVFISGLLPPFVAEKLKGERKLHHEK
jgi:hypothetical protein